MTTSSSEVDAVPGGQTDHITCARGEVALVTINRPELLNAIDLDMLRTLEELFVDLERDPDVRVVILTGAGQKAFVAGGDIADLGSRQGLAHYREFAEVVHRVYRQFECFPKPTIGAINGLALGGGVEIMLSLDIRLISETARIGLPEIKLGLFPGAGGTQRLTRQIGMCRAKELMFTGDMVSASVAVEMGLANRAVEPDRLMEAAQSLGARIAQHSSLTLELLKRAVQQGSEMPLAGGLAYEQAMIGLTMDSVDAHEGCDAFLEKRSPHFNVPAGG